MKSLNTVWVLILGLFLGLSDTSDAQSLIESFDGVTVATNNPWTGDLTEFETSTGQLKSAATVTGEYYLSVPFDLQDTTTWVFDVTMDFGTSGSNFSTFYLMSNNSDLEGDVNGYYVRIGGTEDDIRLYRQDGNSSIVIGNGPEKSIDVNPVDIALKVSRTVLGDWTVEVDFEKDGTFVEYFTAQDATYTTSMYSGWVLKLTSTRGDKFSFDSLYIGPPFKDTIPPVVSNLEILDANTIEITFDEPIVFEASDIEFIGVSNAVANVTTMGNIVQVTTSQSFESLTNYTFEIEGVADDNGNLSMLQSFQELFFVPSKGKKGDIVINEIFVDGSPVVGLPELDYLELYNQSDSVVDLSTYTIEDESGAVVSFQPYFLYPDAYVLVHPETTSADYSIYGDTLQLDLPTLNVGGDSIVLKNSDGLLVHRLVYTSDDYQDEQKDDGGYSLELINPSNHCAVQGNLRASNDLSGGTPNRVNSIIDINFTPDVSVVSVFPINDNIIEIVLEEVFEGYSIDVLLNPFVDVSAVTSNEDTLIVDLTSSLSDETNYEVDILFENECVSFSIDSTFQYVETSTVEKGDLSFNELLFDPETDGSEFIELYNLTDNYFYTNDLTLRLIKTSSNGDTISAILPEGVLITPKSYLVLADDVEGVEAFYPLDQDVLAIELDDFPSLINDGGRIELLYNDEPIDVFEYSDELHFELLDETKGISLEKIELNLPSNQMSSWTSASTILKATPGRENSQLIEVDDNDGVSLQYKVVLPNGDGYKDFLQVNYQLKDEFTANGYIYDLEGREIDYFVKNELIGKEGVLTWDAINKDDQIARTKLYVMYLELVATNGDSEVYKLPFTIAKE